MANSGPQKCRQLQRYTSCGSRLIVGCIPYKIKNKEAACDIIPHQSVEVLVVSSTKKRAEIMFPKGGWEADETMIQAAYRETYEEAGVLGIVEGNLGKWSYKSKSNDNRDREAVMFAFNVKEEVIYWPEGALRTRKWMSVEEVMAECKHVWMKEALARFVFCLSSSITKTDDDDGGGVGGSLDHH
ncbi:nudix hydrolase 18, mitochondrial-like [Zingiber officinale]|uniref:nudix hydrolase 18, mitochondrial-like n=1 Tax=Zingiber officinale TaxID=94328 RepID=UPI001C4B6DCB|nr:nudix hydrolase 18, mitochondrial-like [Zingiber officinale]